ncbi:hypothetical protein ACFQ0B_49020 [Nonomuraea thailandensis]
MRTLHTRIRDLARRHVDLMAQHGTTCDFARQIAAHYPLYVILTLLGLPESDFPRMLHLTQQLFGHDDDETGRGTGTPATTPASWKTSSPTSTTSPPPAAPTPPPTSPPASPTPASTAASSTTTPPPPTTSSSPPPATTPPAPPSPAA